ncbi:hypothetical protein M406DRAFT_326367 [Cryphonectria parasitica EP155]|uniref:Uncharacterized protein n=1 Tax=Cryphonectria parasitica (strain ATCC 38755 / EP155) TaxID=660469 RepID=A0A9P4YCQ4_CRYP1|nr:uncharacterized protein M406DRAFT_326367 [Cryphonectria parasitica EP155]KAF3770956.1 hypothetical protein M406DRAFT_326367 [Cryphonectria parasitica EP155]
MALQYLISDQKWVEIRDWTTKPVLANKSRYRFWGQVKVDRWQAGTNKTGEVVADVLRKMAKGLLRARKSNSCFLLENKSAVESVDSELLWTSYIHLQSKSEGEAAGEMLYLTVNRFDCQNFVRIHRWSIEQ